MTFLRLRRGEISSALRGRVILTLRGFVGD